MDFIVGRTKEKNSLFGFYDKAKNGRGQLVLISGEAGVGKTALVEETLAHSGLKIITARCNDAGNSPYAPITVILRNCIRESGDKKIDCGHLTKYLPYILPEFGEMNEEVDAETLKETITSAFFNIAGKETTAIFIDDIHWADNATMDFLTHISDHLSSKKLIIVCTYRSDEITRDHRVKKFKSDLRRRRKLNEVVIEPLTLENTHSLIAKLIEAEPAKNLTEKIFEITQGFPLFIEELIDSFILNDLLDKNGEDVSLKKDVEVRIPENIKDAVLNHLAFLSDEARNKLEICAVAGLEFNPSLIIKISGDEKGIDELITRNILKEINSETIIFRHSLIREAVNSQIIWSKRKLLHKQIAEHLSCINTSPDLIAEHWLAANENEYARKEFVRSAEASCKVYAYSDAAKSLNKALELWVEGKDEKKKMGILLLYAQCSQLSGNLNESIKALKEIIENNSARVDAINIAEAYRMLANVYALTGSGDLSVESRLKAAEIFYSTGMIADSASELLIASGRYVAFLKLDLAYETSIKSSRQAREAKRLDIETQALALSGNILAMKGKFEEGKNVVQDALSIALKNNLSDAASIIYRRLASSLEYASDYSSAKDAYFSAYNFCVTEGQNVSAQICLGCMSYTLFQTGEWKKSLEICEEVINNKHTPEGSLIIGYSTKGAIYTLRGEIKKASKNLHRSIELSRKLNIIVVELFGLWGLALLCEYDSDVSQAAQYYESMMKLWEKTEDKHDIIIILIWASYFYSENLFKQELTKCTEALSSITSTTGNPEALAGLAFALGENSMLNNKFFQAVDQYKQAVLHLEKIKIPLLQMLINYRLGIAHMKNGDELNARKILFEANNVSKNLGTRPFSVKIEKQLSLLGTKSEESRKEDSEERAAMAGLTRRQSEILELVAKGLTNKEIADKLFLSPRTVDMHVSNILERLNCRTRIEAINKARELKLV